jgi:DNA-binding CsgD family transcriptional regulator
MRKENSGTDFPILVLTRREKEILSLISEGLTNPEMAKKLFVNSSTIDSHRKKFISKIWHKEYGGFSKVCSGV